MRWVVIKRAAQKTEIQYLAFGTWYLILSIRYFNPRISVTSVISAISGKP